MFGARDIFGIKPFTITPSRDGSGLVFGSEIKAFLEHPKFVKAVNENALRPYLTAAVFRHRGNLLQGRVQAARGPLFCV